MVAMILGGICLVYFVMLLSVGMDFSVIWLLVGGFLSASGALHHFGKWHLPKSAALAGGLPPDFCRGGRPYHDRYVCKREAGT